VHAKERKCARGKRIPTPEGFLRRETVNSQGQLQFLAKRVTHFRTTKLAPSNARSGGLEGPKEEKPEPIQRETADLPGEAQKGGE